MLNYQELCRPFRRQANWEAIASGGSPPVTNTWNSAKTQIKAIVNNVVFPIIDAVLAILLFVKISTAYFDYRKHGQFEWVPIAVVFGCLLFSMTCPLYVWEIAGI